eukprot:ctg_586.g300
MTGIDAAPSPLSKSLRLVTWNVDMDTVNGRSRWRHIALQLSELLPDVVLLQEVSARPPEDTTGAEGPWGSTSLEVFQRALGSRYELAYDVGAADAEAYFVAAAVRRDRFRVLEYEYTEFENTVQGRGLLNVLLASVGDAAWRVRVLTAHLESGAEASAVRQAQLAAVVDAMVSVPEQASVFGGDTNLRAKEVPAGLFRVPAAASTGDILRDAFVEAGEPPTLRYTWDTFRNHNKRDPRGKHRGARARYDRIFTTSHWSARSLRLLGTERLGSGVFPSDHFGLFAELGWCSTRRLPR